MLFRSGGTVTGEGWYPFGTNVTVTATPINDYIFINWTEDGTVVSNDPAYSFTATTDRNLIAHFLLTNSIIIATDDNHKFSIFPNPARDVLNIQFLRNENIINQIINIDVFNTLGKAVSVNYNLSSKEGVIIVPVTDIPAGLYFLDIQMNDKSVGKAKVIIIKKI